MPACVDGVLVILNLKVDMSEDQKGCSKCGSTTIHACPGYRIPPWTEEQKAELARVLAVYKLDPKSVETFAGIHASEEFTIANAHAAFANINKEKK